MSDPLGREAEDINYDLPEVEPDEELLDEALKAETDKFFDQEKDEEMRLDNFNQLQ